MNHKVILQNLGFETPPGINYKQAHEDLSTIDKNMSKTISNLIEIIKKGNINLLKLFLANDLGYKIKTKDGVKIVNLSDQAVFENILKTNILCLNKIKITSMVFERFEESYGNFLPKIVADYIHCMSIPVFRYLLLNINEKKAKVYLYQKAMLHKRFDLAKEIKGLSKFKMNYIFFDYLKAKGVDIRDSKKIDSFASNDIIAKFLYNQMRIKSRKKQSSMAEPTARIYYHHKEKRFKYI